MEPEKNDDKGKGRLLPVPADRVVRQSNRLIEAQYELTLIEKRFMIYLMSVIAEADKDYDWYRVDLPAGIPSTCRFLRRGVSAVRAAG